MRNNSWMTLVCSLAIAMIANAQPDHFFFRQVTVADGLNDGTVSAICQDKYGYMWFGSLGGLNRYDGYSVKFFGHNSEDSNSISSTFIESIATSKDGRLWIGFEDGLMEFDYKTSKFNRIHSVGKVRVNDILTLSPDQIYLATSEGLALLNPVNLQTTFFKDSKDTAQANLLKRFSVNVLSYKDHLYIASSWLIKFNPVTKKGTRVDVPELLNARIVAMAVDDEENLFMATFGENQLMRLPKGATHAEIYNRYIFTLPGALTNNISSIKKDSHNNIWVFTAVDGIMLWQPATKSFKKFLHSRELPGTPSVNLHRCAYEDNKGMIWVGGLHGINYFNPTKTLFNSIMPFGDSLNIRNRRMARGMTEDKDGKMWFGTADGVGLYDPASNTYKEWNNDIGQTHELYYNSVRAVAGDRNNDIWIATGSGINRYNRASQMMDFIDPKLFPRGFYFSANTDRVGRIWFGTRDYDGFYWYDPRSDSYHSVAEHPILRQLTDYGGRYFLEDSKGRYWFGLNGGGLSMFDSSSRRYYHWSTADSVKTIAGDVVVDIKEDKKGIIWVSSMGGVTSIDPVKMIFKSYNNSNGLLSNSASAIGIDDWNRVWIATTRGINMFDSTRKSFTAFSEKDGLPTNEFPEHPGYVLQNKDFMFPSFNGYVRFNPLQYKDEPVKPPCYIASYSIFDQEFDFPEGYPKDTTIRLKPGDNFFSIKLLAINLGNPSQVWYAYKLEGLDKEWHYTQDRKAVYTNVPGGNYKFLYKASNDPNNWDVEENALGVRVGYLFYKTVWFWTLLAALAIVLILVQYRYRINKEKELYILENKAHMLEQEKTRVMYESLKQQLNPHFLFNSLTSLSGLIETDQRMASNFLDSMSKIYRYILKNRNSELVSLKEEVEFVKLYIDLQQTRFKYGLQVNLQVDETYCDSKIAPVTIQNMVENAIKHNIIDIDSPLVIDIYTENDYLMVKNNLQKKHMVETSNKQGLASLQNLYMYLSAKPILIEQTDEFFIIKIPLIND